MCIFLWKRLSIERVSKPPLIYAIKHDTLWEFIQMIKFFPLSNLFNGKWKLKINLIFSGNIAFCKKWTSNHSLVCYKNIQFRVNIKETKGKAIIQPSMWSLSLNNSINNAGCYVWKSFLNLLFYIYLGGYGRFYVLSINIYFVSISDMICIMAV